METFKNKSGTKYREKVYFNGKAVVSPLFQNKTHAKKWKRVKLAERDKLNAMGVEYCGEIQLSKFANIFLANKIGLANRSIESYKNSLDQHILPFCGNLKLNKIKLKHGESLKVLLLGKDLSISRINNILNVFKIVLNDAVRTEQLIKSPFTNLSFIPKQERELNYWLPAEVNKFIQSNKDDFYLNLYLLTINLGLRLSEVIGLRWKSISLDQRTITVQEIMTRQGLQSFTKSKKIRYLPMNDTVFSILNEMSTNKNSLEFLFQGKNGKEIDFQHFTQRSFYRAVDRAGVKRIRFHDLRTTFASNFVMNGGDIYALSRLLGHSSVQITQDKYAHLHPSFLASQSSIVNFSLDSTNKDSLRLLS